jgi:thiol-disulfide isomerase/thioredoxin
MPKWLKIEVGDGDESAIDSQASTKPETTPSVGSADWEAGAETPALDSDTRSGGGAGRWVLGLVALLAVAGIGVLAGRLLNAPAGAGIPGAGAPDEAWAYVDGVPVSAAAVDTEFAVQLVLREQLSGQGLAGGDAEAAFRREIVDRLVNRQIVLNDATRSGVAVTDAEIDAELPGLGANFGIDTEMLRQGVFARQPDLAEADWRAWGAQQVFLTRYLATERAQQLVTQSLMTIGQSQDPVTAIAAVLFESADVRFVIDGEVVAAAREGQPAPDFTLPAPDGTSMKLSDFRGRPVMINFWATWCAPCRIEMPLFVNAYESNKEELVIIGVNSQERPDQVIPYVQSAGLTFPIVIDDGTASAIYRVTALPTTFFVDAEGMLVLAHRGAIRSRPELKPFIEQIMPNVQLGRGFPSGDALTGALAMGPRALLGALR